MSYWRFLLRVAKVAVRKLMVGTYKYAVRNFSGTHTPGITGSPAKVKLTAAGTTSLKSWIDRVVQAGRTFTYTDQGPKGLAGGKTVIVASSRGGVYSTSEGGRAMEHQESYLQIVFGFMGITDLRFVRAEGLAMGEAHKAQALAAAELEIKALLAVPANQPRVALTA